MTLIDKAGAHDDLIRRGDALALFAADENVPTQLVRDALNALPARGVGVKPLVWKQISDRTIEAAGVGSTYRIQTAQDGSVRWQSRYMGEWHNAPSVDAAKDAVKMFHEEALSQFVAPTDAAHVNETPKTEHDGADVLTAAQARAPFFFDRYVNGVLMAEGVCIERETTLEGAMQAAARIAAKGPNGEAPVLVYRARAALTTEADNDRQA